MEERHEEIHPEIQVQTELSRDLGLTTALAIGIGTMIAAGIFTLSGLAVRNVGSAAIVAFLMAAIVALFTALTYCEFASIYPRSGEGYLYARKTFPAPVAYFVGWALILGYTSSCAFYIASLSSYFFEFIWESPVESAVGVAFLVGLTLLNIKGTKESGTFQVVITTGKVIMLIWFISAGLGRVDTGQLIEKFSTDIALIGSTAGLVFITFFGFSAIAATAGEVKNPVKTIPRAIFISMGVVTLLYSLVIVVVVAAGLTEYTEAAMGIAAEKFLGPIGGMVIVGGAILSMISASNASIMAGSRVTLAMSRLGHLPARFGTINRRTRTPIIAVMLIGGTTIIFAVSLPLEHLAHFADTVLLLVLIFVNAALIVHRKQNPDMERPFKVPFVPLLPALGIAANLYLLSQIVHHIVPVAMAVFSLALGVVAYLIWKGTQADESALPGEPSRVAEGRYAVKEGQFRVLVPLANPATVTRLIQLAAAVASEREGEIVALRVSVVPDQISPSEYDLQIDQEREILEHAHAEAEKHGLPLTSLVRVGHSAARAILETARERQCDLILMGWKGYTATTQKILGEITDAVVAHARRDIMLAKLTDDQPLRNFLLPTAGGTHPRRAEEYIASVARYFDGTLTVCSVAAPDSTQEKMSEIENELEEAEGRITAQKPVRVNSKIILDTSIVNGIVGEANGYDAVVVGASRDKMYKQILFGNIPESIARRTEVPVILVRQYEAVKDLIGRVMEA